MKKIRLTESQFLKIKELINETSFDVAAKSVIKDGDVLKIYYKNNANSFKVIQSVNGQIIMDSIDEGLQISDYRFFVSFTGLHGDSLELKRVHKTNEKDKLTNIRSWKRLVVKNIRKIEIIRNNKIIDTVTQDDINNTNDKKPESDHYSLTDDDKAMLDNIKHQILKLKPGNTIKFILDDGVITLCAKYKHGLSYELELLSTTSKSNKYDTLLNNRIQIAFNDDIEDDFSEKILGKKKNAIIIKFKVFVGNKPFDFYLEFNTINLGGKCELEEPQNTIDPQDDTAEKEKLKKLAIDATQSILNDPILQKAFYKEPSLLNLLISASEGKDAEGLGILPAINLVNKYNLGKVKKNLGEKSTFFKINKRASFVVTKPISVNFGEKNDILRFKTDREYNGIVKVSENLEISRMFQHNIYWKFVILNSIDNQENTYNTNLLIYETKKNGETLIIGRENNVNIRLTKSSGYIPTKKN